MRRRTEGLRGEGDGGGRAGPAGRPDPVRAQSGTEKEQVRMASETEAAPKPGQHLAQGPSALSISVSHVGANKFLLLFLKLLGVRSWNLMKTINPLNRKTYTHVLLPEILLRFMDSLKCIRWPPLPPAISQILRKGMNFKLKDSTLRPVSEEGRSERLRVRDPSEDSFNETAAVVKARPHGRTGGRREGRTGQPRALEAGDSGWHLLDCLGVARWAGWRLSNERIRERDRSPRRQVRRC